MLRPLRLAAQVSALLTPIGRVHSSFERVCNLAFGDWLIALQLPGLALVPGGITVERAGGWPLPPGATVTWQPAEQLLSLGDEHLTLEGLPVWQSGPPLPVVAPASSLLARAQALTDLIAEQGRGSLARRQGWAEHGWTQIEGLRAALLRKDDLVAAARPLLGLGEGLTPSGDDVLLGLLAGLFYGGSSAGPLGPWLFSEARQATTAVSANYLRFAARGAFSEELEGVARTLLAVAEPDWGLVRHLIGHGHSSGTDTLIGLTLAVETLATGAKIDADRSGSPGRQRHFAGRSEGDL